MRQLLPDLKLFMIKNAKVENFGPIREFYGDFSFLNLLIGPNGTGKSYLLMLIYSMISTFISDSEHCDIEHKLRAVFQERDIRNLITWGCSRSIAKISFGNNSELCLKIDKEIPSIFSAKQLTREDLDLRMDHFNFITMSDVLAVYSAVSSLIEDHPSYVGISDAFSDFCNKLLNLDYPEHGREWSDLVEDLERRMRVRFEVQGGKIVAEVSKKRMGIEQVSSGMRTFSALCLALKKGLICPRSILFIEEPEIHLHPQWLANMAELITEIAKRNVQVFVSTHSDCFLKKVNDIVVGDDELEELTRVCLFGTDSKPQMYGSEFFF